MSDSPTTDRVLGQNRIVTGVETLTLLRDRLFPLGWLFELEYPDHLAWTQEPDSDSELLITLGFDGDCLVIQYSRPNTNSASTFRFELRSFVDVSELGAFIVRFLSSVVTED